jgi:hypothetical protein
MAKQAARLARTLRNPIDMLEVAGIIRDAADAMEKQAAEAGRTNRERPRILRALSFASELEEAANDKIGDHEARLKRG